MMKRNLRPTLLDIARAAGVGLGTASRVINGGENVSPAKLKKVEAAIRQLQYEPNHTARMLRGGSTKMVGLLVPSIADPFFSSCAEAAEEVARQNDSLLMVAVSNNDPVVELEKLSVLMRQRPDGLLVAPANADNRRFRTFVRGSAVPIVTMDRPVPGCQGVVTDNYAAARKAVAHLIEHGYRRILCYTGGPQLYTIRERQRGYSDQMKEAGLAQSVDQTFDENFTDAEVTLAKYLRGPAPPEAVFTLKNSATVATFQALQRLEIAVPRKVALFGFDDFLLAGAVEPSISVVQQPIYEVGHTAAELLFERLKQSKAKPAARTRSVVRPIVLQCTIMPRRSCGCRA
jgi:LacI family transcriptional regulator